MSERDAAMAADVAQLQSTVDELRRRIMLVMALALALGLLTYTLTLMQGRA